MISGQKDGVKLAHISSSAIGLNAFKKVSKFMANPSQIKIKKSNKLFIGSLKRKCEILITQKLVFMIVVMMH
ncbi:hypothetical protein LBMAG43_00770 [Methylococcaceae bacterium]|nr:hypothetical protein LBMAG43_00770 [Methylococcaceae bacterium]